MTETLTAKTAFAELDPALDSLIELVNKAPLAPAGRLELALLVAAKTLGVACAHLKLANPALKDAENSAVLKALAELMGDAAAQREALEAAKPTGEPS